MTLKQGEKVIVRWIATDCYYLKESTIEGMHWVTVMPEEYPYMVHETAFQKYYNPANTEDNHAQAR